MDHPLGWEAAGTGRGDLVPDGHQPVRGQRTPTVSSAEGAGSTRALCCSYLGCADMVSVDGLGFVFAGTQVVRFLRIL